MEVKRMREVRSIGRMFDAEIEIYSECKYTAALKTLEESKRVRYNGIVNWEIVSGEDAQEIESHTDDSCIDDLREYLVLHFENGETATFRNSYVDMFRV